MSHAMLVVLIKSGDGTQAGAAMDFWVRLTLDINSWLFHRDCAGHAAADAQGRQAPFGPAMREMRQQPRSRSAQGMSQRDDSAVRIHFCRVEPQFADTRD